jgi:hypothetical protein
MLKSNYMYNNIVSKNEKNYPSKIIEISYTDLVCDTQEKY